MLNDRLVKNSRDSIRLKRSLLSAFVDQLPDEDLFKQNNVFSGNAGYFSGNYNSGQNLSQSYGRGKFQRGHHDNRQFRGGYRQQGRGFQGNQNSHSGWYQNGSSNNSDQNWRGTRGRGQADMNWRGGSNDGRYENRGGWNDSRYENRSGWNDSRYGNRGGSIMVRNEQRGVSGDVRDENKGSNKKFGDLVRGSNFVNTRDKSGIIHAQVHINKRFSHKRSENVYFLNAVWI